MAPGKVDEFHGLQVVCENLQPAEVVKMQKTVETAVQLLEWLAQRAHRKNLDVVEVLRAALDLAHMAPMFIEPPKANPHVAAAKALIEQGRRFVNASAISSAKLSAALPDAPKTKAMNELLAQLGFVQYGMVKADGEAHRVWASVPVANNEHARALLRGEANANN